MIQAFLLSIGFFPAPLQVVIMGFLATLILILVLKIVSLVLNAIPFL